MVETAVYNDSSLLSETSRSAAPASTTVNVEKQFGEERRRFLILGLFLFLTGSNSFQWVQYTIVSEQVKILFNSTLPASGAQFAIDTSATVFMITYFILLIPSYFLMQGRGLRLSILLGSGFNALGTIIKCFGQNYLSFGILMFGQVISAIAQTFTLGQPSHLAALWFRQEITSLIASIGVFANQLGIAFGFIVPTLLLNKIQSKYNSDTEYEAMFENLRNGMMFGIAVPLCVVSSVIFVLILALFADKPRIPASRAEQIRQETTNTEGIMPILKDLCNRSFCALFITYGLVAGVFYAISVNVQKYYAEHHPDIPEAAGIVGLIIVICGLFGSVCAGIVLSWTKAFKLVSAVTCALNLVFMIIYSGTLHLNIYIGYVVAGCLGFAMTGFLPIGFELAAETTYPINEDISSGILNWSAQIFGIILTYSHAAIIGDFKSLPSNIFLIVCLLLATIASFFVKKGYKRMEAEKRRAIEERLRTISSE